MLTRRQRRIARQVARRCYIDNPGDIEAAELAFKTDRQIVSIDPAIVVLLIQIAWALWRWWRERNVTTPSEHWQSNEPYFESD